MLLYATIGSLLLCIACVDVVPGKVPIIPLVNMSKMNNVDGKSFGYSLCVQIIPFTINLYHSSPYCDKLLLEGIMAAVRHLGMCYYYVINISSHSHITCLVI